jgi:hypothetical protein
MRKFPDGYVKKCNWDKDRECDQDMYCDGMPTSASPEDKQTARMSRSR